jgi:excisionase family DNA binding protein
MFDDLPKDPNKQNLVPISEAAEFLGVSIDTVRRWDKKGKIKAVRPNGKDRFFSFQELERVNFSKPKKISDASKKLNLSQSTLRRLEEKGIIVPKRNNKGERVYDYESVRGFLDSEYYFRKKFVEEEILEPLKPDSEKSDIGKVAKELDQSKREIKKPTKPGDVLPYYAHPSPKEKNPVTGKKPPEGHSPFFKKDAPHPMAAHDHIETPVVTAPVVKRPDPKGVDAHEKDEHKVIDYIVTEHHKSILDLKSFKRVLFLSLLFASVFFGIIVLGLTTAFLLAPEETADFLGYKRYYYNVVASAENPELYDKSAFAEIIASSNEDLLGIDLNVLGDSVKEAGPVATERFPTEEEEEPLPSVFARALRPFSYVSLLAVQAIDEDTYRKILPKKKILDINDVLTVNNQGQVVPVFELSFADTNFLDIPDTELVVNLNAEFVQGKTPGYDTGNLVIWSEDNTIQNLNLGEFNLADGSVIGGRGGIILDESVDGWDIKDLSINTALRS